MTQSQDKTSSPDLSGTPPVHDEAVKMVQDALDEAQDSVGRIQEQADELVGMEAPRSLLDDPKTPEGINMLRDVDLHVSIELGRTQMLVEDVLKISEGSVIELDKLAGDPVDVYVNGRLVARGEVLVLNDNFCIRVSEIIANLQDEASAQAVQETAANT